MKNEIGTKKTTCKIVVVVIISILLCSCATTQQMPILAEKEPLTSEGHYFREERDDVFTIDIKYPQLLPDAPNCDAINSSIFNYIVLPEYTRWNSERLNVELTYSITTLSTDILSILFYGYSSTPAQYRNIDSALVFDMTTGALLKLEDIIDTELLLKSLEQGTLKYTVNLSGKESFNALQAEVDSLLVQYFSSSKEQNYNFFISEDCIGILLSPNYMQGKETMIVNITIPDSSTTEYMGG